MPWSELDSADEKVTQLGYESIGRLVRTLRRRAGWTQQELQGLSGVHQSVISRLENGKRCGISWARFGRLIGTLGGLDALGLLDPSSRAPRLPLPRDGPGHAADSHTE